MKNKDSRGERVYQISTLNALPLGYTRKVVTVADLLAHSDTGLGTFENLDGEMIVSTGVPFASVGWLKGSCLNSMHIVRIDGFFEQVDARSENGLRTQHVELKELLGMNQKAFTFERNLLPEQGVLEGHQAGGAGKGLIYFFNAERNS